MDNIMNIATRKLPSDIIERLLTQSLQMLMMCVDDDISWDEEALRRLAIARGENVIVPNSPYMLPDFLKDDDWKKRYAALTYLGLIASGCSKMLVQYLEPFLERIMGLVRDQHPRVRWAAIGAICEFSKYLNPYFQEQCHQQVIHALSDTMYDFGNPSVQTHAASTLLIFSRNCCLSILKLHLKEIISHWLVFLQKGKAVLKETALEAIASLADSTKDDFQPFYVMVMPYLKLILVKENSNCKLVAKTLDCITVVGVAVGKSIFSPDVEEIVKVLVSLQEYNRNTYTDGQVTCHLLQAWGQLCISLGDDFRPYLSASIPQLIESTGHKDYLMTCDCNSKTEQRSIVLKEMLLACNTLGCFAAHTKGGLHLWIEEVLEVVLPLVNIKFDDQVIIAAISVMPLLLQSATIATENKLRIPGYLDSPIITLPKIIIPALVEALQAPSIKIQVKTLVALNQSIQIASTWAPDDMEIIGNILMVLSACFQRKKERENSANNRKPERLIKEEIQDEKNICKEFRICLQVLLKRFYARNLLPQIPYVRQMWEKDIATEERRMGLNIFSDIAEQFREEGLKHYVKYIPILFQACKDTNPEIQEVVACAIGIYVEFGSETFKHHVRDGLSSLEVIIQQPYSRTSVEHAMAKETAISAYGKVCFFLCEEINSYEYIEFWLFHLPIKCDSDLAKATHKLLCSMIEKPETKVTGPDDGYIGRIIEIMAEVLGKGYYVTKETQSKMVQQLKMFKQKLAHKFLAICNTLSPFLQQRLSFYLVIDHHELKAIEAIRK